jgi:hypothetical protein
MVLMCEKLPFRFSSSSHALQNLPAVNLTTYPVLSPLPLSRSNLDCQVVLFVAEDR